MFFNIIFCTEPESDCRIALSHQDLEIFQPETAKKPFPKENTATKILLLLKKNKNNHK